MRNLLLTRGDFSLKTTENYNNLISLLSVECSEMGICANALNYEKREIVDIDRFTSTGDPQKVKSEFFAYLDEIFSDEIVPFSGISISIK